MSRNYSGTNSEEMDQRLAECLQQEEYERERLRVQEQQRLRPSPQPAPMLVVQPSPQVIYHPSHHHSHHCHCWSFGGRACSFHRHTCCPTPRTSSNMMDCIRCHRSMVVYSNFLSFNCPHCGQFYQKTTTL